MESCWANSKPAYRCRHGHSSAATPDPGRPKNLYIREDCIVPHLPALYVLLAAAEPVSGRRRRTRHGIDVQRSVSEDDAIAYLRAREIMLTCDPRIGTLQADTPEAVKTVITWQANTRALRAHHE